MEKAVLVELKLKSDRTSILESLLELKQLAESAGALVVGELTQKKDSPDPKFYIGVGKLDELKLLCETTQANVVIFDNELSPSQNKNLEEFLKVKVINRTELILDIFAQHAHSKEGKLQVELACTEYQSTHLTGHGIELSRLGGGIGTRGPGETKLETDKRAIKAKISYLKKETEKVRKAREIIRQKRKTSNLKSISLIGYTNSGKSSLLNALAKSSVLTEDKLFATLDPVTRRLYLPSSTTILLTDTVGFIKNLPHFLISAFRATLEETEYADILIHVVDSSSFYVEDQINSVFSVLEELNVFSKPIITVFNKIDKVEKKSTLMHLKRKYRPSVLVSAIKKEGLDSLIELIDETIKTL